MTTAASLPIGASSADLRWGAIDWQTAERSVRRLQMRIAKAVRDITEPLGQATGLRKA